MSNKEGVRHAIKCRCILQQHLNKNNPPFFTFPVFSILEDDIVIPKTVQCPSCGILHKIFDIGKSNILTGKEDSKSLITLEDLKVSMPQKLVNILELYNIDISQWEMASYIIENEKWQEYVILNNEIIDGKRCGKYIRILGKELYKIESYEVEQ